MIWFHAVEGYWTKNARKCSYSWQSSLFSIMSFPLISLHFSHKVSQEVFFCPSKALYLTKSIHRTKTWILFPTLQTENWYRRNGKSTCTIGIFHFSNTLFLKTTPWLSSVEVWIDAAIFWMTLKLKRLWCFYLLEIILESRWAEFANKTY